MRLDSATKERLQNQKKEEKHQKILHLKKKLHKAEDDLTTFVQIFISNGITFKRIPPFHKDIYSQIAELKGFKLIVSPRGHAKSTVCSVIFPLWCAMYGKKKAIIIVSASQTLSVEMLRKIKLELETNPVFKIINWKFKTKKWSESHIQIRSLKGGICDIKALGAGGQTRGWRPDLFILDDIENDESVESEDQRRKLKEWMNKAVMGTLLPGGQIVMIGTILHQDSLLKNVLDNPIGWGTSFYQAYIDCVENEEHVLWPEQFSHQDLQERKRVQGSFAFAQEYLNNPVADETLPVKRHHIRYWDNLPQQYSCVIAIDPAYSDENTADYKVASLIAIDSNHNRYLITYIRTHAPQGEFVNGVLNLYLQHKNRISGIGIPASGTEREFYNTFQRLAQERKIYPPIVEVKNYFKSITDRTHRRKKDRIVAALQSLFEAGKYYIHKNHKEAEDELLSIGVGKYDDLVDTLAYGEQFITPTYYEPNVPRYDAYGQRQAVKGFDNYGY